MITVQEYQQLVKDVADLERKEAETEGALAQMTKALQAEHGCATLAAAKAKLAKLQAELAEAEPEADAAFKEFTKKRGDLLRG